MDDTFKIAAIVGGGLLILGLGYIIIKVVRIQKKIEYQDRARFIEAVNRQYVAPEMRVELADKKAASVISGSPVNVFY